MATLRELLKLQELYKTKDSFERNTPVFKIGFKHRSSR